MAAELTPFWISFPMDPSFPMGFGVTAWSEEDAFHLLVEQGYDFHVKARSVDTKASIGVDDLDPHVRQRHGARRRARRLVPVSQYRLRRITVSARSRLRVAVTARPRAGHQLVEPALGMILHARDDVGEIGKRIDAACLARVPGPAESRIDAFIESLQCRDSAFVKMGSRSGSQNLVQPRSQSRANRPKLGP